MDNYCQICHETIPGRRFGPHMSAHVRSANRRSIYTDPGKKHPRSLRECPTCGEEKWIANRATYCSVSCARKASLNPAWKGNEATAKSARLRAHRVIDLAESQCCRCAATENLHRHHRDENTYNNDPSNLEVLCQSCHFAEHTARARAHWNHCVVCGDITSRMRGKYCGQACMGLDRRGKPTGFMKPRTPCEVCGEPCKRPGSKLCSKACLGVELARRALQ